MQTSLRAVDLYAARDSMVIDGVASPRPSKAIDCVVSLSEVCTTSADGQEIGASTVQRSAESLHVLSETLPEIGTLIVKVTTLLQLLR